VGGVTFFFRKTKNQKKQKKNKKPTQPTQEDLVEEKRWYSPRAQINLQRTIHMAEGEEMHCMKPTTRTKTCRKVN